MLRHIVVAAGSPAQWAGFSEEQWRERELILAQAAATAHARHITLYPYDPQSTTHAATSESTQQMVPHNSLIDGITVVINPHADGRQRVSDVLSSWTGTRPITEKSLGEALCAEAGEPDLVIIAGPPHQLPASLVWELAYSEIVFIETTWSALCVENIAGAIHEFAARHRRFGGVE